MQTVISSCQVLRGEIYENTDENEHMLVTVCIWPVNYEEGTEHRKAYMGWRLQPAGKPASKNVKLWCAAFADFHGVNIPTLASLTLAMV